MSPSRNTKDPRRTPPRRTEQVGAGRRLARLGWRLLKAIGVLPPVIRVLAGVILILATWYAVNWGYQVYHKPTEMFFPLSGGLTKSPVETWQEYGPLFSEHSTAVITPEFLAALAQIESAGNPVAQTYWRWRLTWNPFKLYQPASSAVGMYQITDATFHEAKRYCIHDHLTVEEGPWYDMKSCWFNSLYTRVMPSHAIEMTAAMLDRTVAKIMKRHRIGKTTLGVKQDLAAVIHLCGAGAGNAYAKRGLRLSRHQRCGDHKVSNYLAKLNAMKRQFAKLAATSSAL